MMKNRLLILFLPLLLSVVPAAAKGLSAEKRKEISQMLTRILDREVAGCKTNVTQVVDAGNRLTLYASIGMSYYPFRERSVAAIYDSIRSLLPASLARRRLSLVTDKHPIEELIPQIYRSGSRGKTFTNRSDRPLVTRLSSPVKPTHGLAGRHIAMWQSHGRYFDQEENRWRWQRSRLWETCEDLYTQSYVLPYLVPMLERAGANVLLPRERDVQTEEAIADNDAGVDEGSSYVEFTGDRRWFDAGTGFAHRREVYVECQNPFAEGTARGVQTVTDGRESRAEWSADLPASGEYAVYVSYKTVERSSEDALYTVRHLGGESRFAVQSDHGRRHMDLSGDIPLRGGTKSCVGHAEQPLVEKEPRRDGRRREDRRRHGQRRPARLLRSSARRIPTISASRAVIPVSARAPAIGCNGRDFPKRSTARRKGSTTTRRITCRAPTGSTRSWAAPNGCPTKRV